MESRTGRSAHPTRRSFLAICEGPVGGFVAHVEFGRLAAFSIVREAVHDGVEDARRQQRSLGGIGRLADVDHVIDGAREMAEVGEGSFFLQLEPRGERFAMTSQSRGEVELSRDAVGQSHGGLQSIAIFQLIERGRLGESLQIGCGSTRHGPQRGGEQLLGPLAPVSRLLDLVTLERLCLPNANPSRIGGQEGDLVGRRGFIARRILAMNAEENQDCHGVSSALQDCILETTARIRHRGRLCPTNLNQNGSRRTQAQQPPNSLLWGSVGVVLLGWAWIVAIQTAQTLGWTFGIPIGMTLCFAGFIFAYCRRESLFVAEHQRLVAEHENEVSRLKSEHPQLLIEFIDNDEQFFYSGYFWARVRSEANTRTARNVVVQIAMIEPLGVVTDEALEQCRGFLSYSIYSRFSSSGQGVFAAEASKDIHSGQHAMFSIAFSQLWGGDKIVIGNHEHGHRGHILKGAYRVRLVASADDFRPAELPLVIGVNDKGAVICEIDKSA